MTSEWTWMILLLERGNTLVGEFRQHPNDLLALEARNVATVRLWGTSHGLGQLAEEGPIKGKTVLDLEKTVWVLKLKILKAIECNAEVWNAGRIRR